MMLNALLCLLLTVAQADKQEDLVSNLPGFGNITWPFRLYSGLLDVPGPINGYDSLKIHYQFHTSRHSPETDPVVTWHQGGPGGSSILVGLYGEMGAFVVGQKSNYLNPWAWNKVANMLYLESPAGSGGSSGYSVCIKGGVPVTCHWNDVSQGEAYAHTLQAFFKAFPEFSANDLYLTGESYFGQYGPNIANYILKHETFKSKLNLKGLALGNACWGGNSTCVACNGPSEDKIDVDLYFGKGLFSPKLYREIQKVCKFPTEYTTCSNDDDPAGHSVLSDNCKQLLERMHKEVGPHNIYFIYDNCPQTQDFLTRSGKDMAWLRAFLRKGMHDPQGTNEALINMNGGYRWDCGGDVNHWIHNSEVRKALHLETYQPGASKFEYDLSGPASITLYPSLVKELRVLIYNGDADACVPYNGNEDWIGDLESQGIIKETSPWKPWYSSKASTPAGYITRYEAENGDSKAKDFSFMTIRLAGHMVPQFQPEAAFAMISKFLAGTAAGHSAVVV